MMLERDSLLAYSPAIRAFELNMWAWDGRPLSWPYPTFIELIRRGRFDRSHHWTYKTDTAWAISIAATITYKINKNSSMNYVVWNAVSDMATNADADISICLTCQSLGQFICHVLTMAIDLRGDEQTIRLNIEKYTKWTTLVVAIITEWSCEMMAWCQCSGSGTYIGWTTLVVAILTCTVNR